MAETNKVGEASSGSGERDEACAPTGRPSSRRAYEAPRVLKKRSLTRITLVSGSGVQSGGLPANG